MTRLITTLVLLAAGAYAQFGPTAASSSASLGPAPTESIGCRIVNGAWECSAPRNVVASSSASSAVQATSLEPTSTTPTETSVASSGVPPPPAESTGCELHGDHYHCEGPAEGYEGSTPTVTAEPSIPSPTESSNCIWRE
jgi:zinc transporter 1/2/3